MDYGGSILIPRSPHGDHYTNTSVNILFSTTLKNYRVRIILESISFSTLVWIIGTSRAKSIIVVACRFLLIKDLVQALENNFYTLLPTSDMV